MIRALRSKTMQKNRFSRSLVVPLLLSFAAGRSLAAETEYSLKVDAVAPLTEFWTSMIVEGRVERKALSVFVSPELIARKYQGYSWAGIGDTREISAKGLGIWTGFGYRPSPDDFARPFRTALGLRARWYDADMTTHGYGSVFNGRYDSTIKVVSKRKEVTSSVGVFTEAAWTSFPFGGSDFLRTTMVEPYARLGLRSDWIETTAFEGGDRVPGTSSSHQWTRDLRWGVFVGKVF